MKMHGAGINIVDIGDFKNAICHGSFLKSKFTERELEHCGRYSFPEPHIAARWAAKAAVLKALGRDGRSLKTRDIEILNRKGGAPFLSMRDRRLRKKFRYYISLSHSDTKAMAFALVSKERSR